MNQIDERINLLESVDLFNRLNREELEVVARHSEIIELKRGTVIFGENTASRELYIVKEGEVLITKHRGDSDLDLAHYLPIECFGELDLFGALDRQATAVTIKDTSILIFPHGDLDLPDVLQLYPRISAQILHKLLAIIAARVRKTHKLISLKSTWMDGLKRTLYVDKLTGLYNKYYLSDDLRKTLPASEGHTSLLMIKPDNFKDLNDIYGHTAGDKVLILIAIFIQSILRETDLAIRYHGDEFTVVLPETEVDQAVSLAQEIGTALYDMDISEIIDGNKYKISVSIGVGTYPVHGTGSDELIDLVYEKMFKAREKGGNRIIAARKPV